MSSAGKRSGRDVRIPVGLCGGLGLFTIPKIGDCRALPLRIVQPWVLDRDEKDWKSAIRYYNLRNQIAHGQLQARRIEVPKVVADFYLIQGAMR